MALPKRKTSKRVHAMKQSHHAYSRPSLSACPQCHSPKPPHRICLVCGMYRDREVLQVNKAKR